MICISCSKVCMCRNEYIIARSSMLDRPQNWGLLLTTVHHLLILGLLSLLEPLTFSVFNCIACTVEMQVFWLKTLPGISQAWQLCIRLPSHLEHSTYRVSCAFVCIKKRYLDTPYTSRRSITSSKKSVAHSLPILDQTAIHYSHTTVQRGVSLFLALSDYWTAPIQNSSTTKNHTTRHCLVCD